MSEKLLRTAFNLHQAGNLAEAARLYGEILRRDPKHFDALYLLGFAEYQRGQFADAERLMADAIKVNPRSLDALYNRAAALLQLNRQAEALSVYDAALASVERALAIKADDADAQEDRGNLLMRLNRHAEAAAAYDSALALNPKNIHTLYNRGNALSILKRLEEAMRDCESVLSRDPDYPYARGVLVHCKLQCCDWRDFDGERGKIASALAAGKRVVSPFNHKALSDSAAEQLQCAKTWVRHECPPSPAPLWRGERYRHDRIRLAYVSADFNLSAVATLIAGVFEHHDRKRFETIAVSFGSSVKTEMRDRLVRAFQHFEEKPGLNHAGNSLMR